MLLLTKPFILLFMAEEQKAKSSDGGRTSERVSGRQERGYAMVALDSPSHPVNVGHTLRAAMCFDTRLVILSNATSSINLRRLPTDPGRTWRHTPVLSVESVFESLPYDCTPVAIELTDDAEDLVDFQHPERACYIFGPEKGSLSQETLNRCDAVLKIPVTLPLNLAATVNVVLYDRMLKMRRPELRPGGNNPRTTR
ncbi:MAG TPA: TrmH family RNA methyltransferase [Dehalococcoidia bacterium]|jgi:tRNA(Leu) C34 or U34 (ribose-2'-O)-methylase TrmL|nr:23S rRNA methyltransferase [Chloroflexota bacterium]MDP5877949.1 TrmH family RNA methyltransferase [Dehalococcoidia bacterium]MDP6273684.1 TrmH family RNA methyltransferase [Dehalococcoidia bacterium]MDP7160683.1 TrmH family RNA methyltransferase [Dehalococcoidia bacterium]MDP7214045.1 TrmH family RNA methyltransferase [Dehalococcoidia bacterium]|tara:strand:+ start:130 stop:720 length:591 start_codon:yes stop_codon:yes gene_type:complete